MDRATRCLEYFAIGIQDEVVLNLSADFVVTARSSDGKVLGRAGIDLDIEIHCERGGVEGRTEIGRGAGERQPERRWFQVLGFHGHVQIPESRLASAPGL